MHAIARVSLLTLALGLSACAVQHPQPRTTAPTIPSLPQTSPSSPNTTLPVTPSKPSTKPAPRTSASFAPPPGGASHWEPKLGVYVLDGQANTYYRQRTYYRWDGGSWTWSTSLNGPWQSTDTGGVPPGLGRLHAQ
ncbi:hypothetical protein [Pseudomonas sp. TE3610]